MLRDLPFPTLVATDDSVLSRFADAYILFADAVTEGERVAIEAALPLPLTQEPPLWRDRLLYVQSQEYPSVALRYAYSPEVRAHGDRAGWAFGLSEGWEHDGEDLFSLVTEAFDDEATEQEVAASRFDLVRWLARTHAVCAVTFAGLEA